MQIIPILTIISVNLSMFIQSGQNQNCFLYRNLSILYCWGSNVHGESEIPFPMQNQDLSNISIGRMQVCGIILIKISDTCQLFCWGNNEFGQASIPDANKSSVQAKAGDQHTCAMNFEKKLDCWGLNDHGQSEPFNLVRLEAYQVRGNVTLVVDNGQLKIFGDTRYYNQKLENLQRKVNFNLSNLALGYNHQCIYEKELICVGDNQQGQVSPPNIKDSIMIRTQSNHSCAISFNNQSETDHIKNKLNCWGSNDKNQLDVPISNDIYNSIATGLNHTCVHFGQLKVKCQGTNEYQLDIIPSIMNNLITFLKTGGEFTCAVIGGILKCVGKNKNKMFDIPSDQKYGKLSTGQNHVCGIILNFYRSQDQIKCWGLKDNSILEPPSNINNTLKHNTKMESGYKFNCAITDQTDESEKNQLTCWGVNNYGQLDTQIEEIDVPEDVKNNSVHAGIAHACLRNFKDIIQCWGSDEHGQSSIPDRFQFNIRIISTGYYHNCVVMNMSIGINGGCWGSNSAGQSDMPMHLQHQVLHVATGGSHSCGMDRNLSVHCWGSNKSKQLKVPSLPKVNQFSLGEKHSCAQLMSGIVQCWGDNKQGQIELNKGN